VEQIITNHQENTQYLQNKNKIMEQSKQEKVVELYKRKSELFNDLSNLNNNDYKFVIGYDSTFNMYGASKLNSVSKSFLAEIKILTEKHIEDQIKEIDKELESL